MRRLLPLTLAAFLLSGTAAFAKPLSLQAPAEAQTTITVVKGAKRITVKSAPKGVIVLGSASHGKAAVAIARPRGAATGTVVLNVKGKPKTAATTSACKVLGTLLGRRLAGPSAIGLGAVLAARACGKPDPSGAAALLAKLGFGPAQQTGGTPGAGGSLQRPPAKPGPTPTPEPSIPGVPAACAQSSYVSQGDDDRHLFVGINQGCPAFTQVTVEVGATVAACEAITSEHNFTCGVADGKAVAKGGTAQMLDMAVTLTGAANCKVDAKVTFTLAGGGTQRLVEPIVDCGLIAVTPQCSNGTDDDGDGMSDARETAGATDPDPGCSGPNDTTENSDGDLMEGCEFETGPVQGDQRFLYLAVANCGSIEGLWFKPPGTPADCTYVIGHDAALSCPVVGTTASATFAPTTDQVLVATHLTADATCGTATLAVTLAGGAVMSLHGDWCHLPLRGR
jgi:hypothetical protein